MATWIAAGTTTALEGPRREGVVPARLEQCLAKGSEVALTRAIPEHCAQVHWRPDRTPGPRPAKHSIRPEREREHRADLQACRLDKIRRTAPNDGSSMTAGHSQVCGNARRNSRGGDMKGALVAHRVSLRDLALSLPLVPFRGRLPGTGEDAFGLCVVLNHWGFDTRSC